MAQYNITVDDQNEGIAGVSQIPFIPRLHVSVKLYTPVQSDLLRG